MSPALNMRAWARDCDATAAELEGTAAEVWRRRASFLRAVAVCQDETITDILLGVPDDHPPLGILHARTVAERGDEVGG